MNKKILLWCIAGIAVVLLVLFVFPIGERAGVPSQQIKKDIQDGSLGTVENLSYSHDVDTKLHTDVVTVEYDEVYQYLIEHRVCEYEYFYNKEKDVWELEDTKLISSRRTFSETIANAKFTGSDDYPLQSGLRYEISVVEVDYLNCGITVAYTITEGSQTFSGEAKVGFGNGYKVLYNVVSNRAVGIRIYFWLMDGIRAEYY